VKYNVELNIRTNGGSTALSIGLLSP